MVRILILIGQVMITLYCTSLVISMFQALFPKAKVPSKKNEDL